MTKPFGRSLSDFDELLPAEKRLRDAARLGEIAILGNLLPSERTAENEIRAGFLRFLALGGDENAPVHEQGVQIFGAWISDTFDVTACDIPGNFGVYKSHFADAPVLRDSHFHGLLNLRGSRLPGLAAESLIADDGVFLGNGFSSTGEVCLLGAHIIGNLSCRKGSFNNPNGDALNADGANIDGDVFIDEAFKAQGRVRLSGARIGGNFECSNGCFNNANGIALSADHANIEGNAFLSEGFQAQGGVRLLAARIRGNLECSKGCFNNANGIALTADKANIEGNVFLNEGFQAQGKVRLLGTRIGGALDCRNGSFVNANGDALNANSADIDGDVILAESFQAQGAVCLHSTQIGGSLYCDGGIFCTEQENALVAEKMSVSGNFIFQEISKPVAGVILDGAEVGALIDDEQSWGNGLSLDGFIYRRLGRQAPCDAATRIAWLKKQRTDDCNTPDSFKPQPWKQLIRTLRKMGHEEEARQVAIAYETHRRKYKIIRSPISRVFHWLFGLVIAYGYRPQRLFFIMIAAWLFCGGLFWTAALNDVFAPSNPLVFHHSDYAACRPGYLPGPMQPNVAYAYGNWYLCPQLAGEYTGFSPLAYSADLILPLVDLQQEHDWAPYIPTPEANWWNELTTGSKYHWTRLLVWFEILFGWVASLLLVAVVSGLTNRDKDD